MDVLLTFFYDPSFRVWRSHYFNKIIFVIWYGWNAVNSWDSRWFHDYIPTKKSCFGRIYVLLPWLMPERFLIPYGIGDFFHE